MIVGIDEVGRGAWAGPLVVGAVLLGGVEVEGLTDSKKLTKKQRILLDREIRQRARAIGLGWVSARHIDQIGLSEALKLASRRALAHIRQEYHEIIIDGTIRLIDDPRARTMKQADLLIPSVSAASVIAKVARDNYMARLDQIFPGYKFASHVGYGTASHRLAIEERGATVIHRLSFAPLRDYALPAEKGEKSGQVAKTTKQRGDEAETIVAEYLEQHGHIVIARNWRTKYCEVDIISQKNNTLYFTEVKYRRNDVHGSGLEAVTGVKQRQMRFAAELFLAKFYQPNVDAILAVADVSGGIPEVREFLELR